MKAENKRQQIRNIQTLNPGLQSFIVYFINIQLINI